MMNDELATKKLKGHKKAACRTILLALSAPPSSAVEARICSFDDLENQ
jgi:hypothetical protein